MPGLTTINNLKELRDILSRDSGKLTVIDFYADWCGPCRMIAPAYEAFSKEYTNVNFLKCNVDEARDVAMEYSVAAMPTFIFLKGGSKVETVRGANKGEIERALRKHSEGSSSGAFSGQGQRLGSSESPSADVAPGGDIGPLANMSPQAKMFGLLVAAYVVLWYFKS
ncbi:thioredoxin-domain-containing protein [Schizopora paradoxa]|uniref:Thioredoxin-domain-containing protein n=1 Tax=Schizopora paradoxa TaxID=27342 RepID=A0A0H2S8I1_9AGAM|nr:thioredoxin-domain-containing protein [Schizopora paradoxa]